jgi:hypothetical protein
MRVWFPIFLTCLLGGIFLMSPEIQMRISRDPKTFVILGIIWALFTALMPSPMKRK